MKLTNNWVGYLERSYDQIKTWALYRLGQVAPEMNDHSSNNPLIILIDFFAGVAEQINYYVDTYAREAFVRTAELFKSMVNLAKPFDYRIKSSVPESVDLTFTLDTEAPVGGATIPSGTKVSGGGYQYITDSNLIIEEGDTEGIISAKQVTEVSAIQLGTTDGTENQEINLGANYVYGSASAEIDGDTYDLVETFAYSDSDDTHFIIEIDENKDSIAIFGDDINGIIPVSGKEILFSYQETDGPDGYVSAGELTTIINPPTIPGISEITVTNEDGSSGGNYVETIESIRKNIPIHTRTLERAVTKADYEDIALLYPGVAQSKANFCCGKSVTIYIGPVAGDSGAIASLSLLEDVEDFFEDKRMFTTTVNADAAGISEIYMVLSATAKLRKDPTVMQQDIEDILVENYNYNASSINRSLRESDIYALVDNLNKVDFASIESLVLQPYARPIDHDMQLDWDRSVATDNISKVLYVVGYPQAGKFTLARDGRFINVYDMGVEYSDDYITFTITESDLYEFGYEWKFTVYPSNGDIEVDDFTIPVLIADNLTITPYKSTENTQCNTICE